MDSPVHLTFQQCLAFHTEDDTESQKDRFQQVVDEILKGKHFLKVVFAFFLRCRKRSCYPICTLWYVKSKSMYTEPLTVRFGVHCDVVHRLGSHEPQLSLCISIACESNNEKFAIPIRICLTPSKPFDSCPDIFLVYDQSSLLCFLFLPRLVVEQTVPLHQSGHQHDLHSLHAAMGDEQSDSFASLTSSPLVFAVSFPTFAQYSPPLLLSPTRTFSLPFSSLARAVDSISSSHIDCTFLIPPSAYRKLRKLGSGACGAVYEGCVSACVFTQIVQRPRSGDQGMRSATRSRHEADHRGIESDDQTETL